MQELYDLKEMLCDELKEYGKKGELTAGSLDVVDKLTHTIKNLNKIIDKYEEDEYSGNYMYDDGMMHRMVGRSYARGRNAKRDSMGRYSRHGDMIGDLYDLMEEAPDERTKMELQKFIKKMEQSM